MKLYFQLELFNIMPIFFGIAKITASQINISSNFFKLKTFQYKNLIKIKSKVKPLKDYHIINFNLLIDTDYNENFIITAYSAFLYQRAVETIGSILSIKKPYFKLNCQFNAREGDDLLKIYLKSTLIFNTLMIILSIIKILMEKLIYVFRKK